MLTGHTSVTVQRQGWTSMKNGKLLALAAEAGFDVLLTADKGMEYQQNLAALPRLDLDHVGQDQSRRGLGTGHSKRPGSTGRDEASNPDSGCLFNQYQIDP